MYVKFMVHDLTFTWPPEVAGQTFRMASPATISERGAQKGAKVCYELKSTGTDPEYIQRREQEWLAGRPERRERRRQDYTARRAYHRRLQHERARYYRDLDGSDDESSGDEDEDYEGYESSTPTEQALLNSDHTLHRQDYCSLVPPPDVVLNLALSSLAIEPHLVNIHPHLVRAKPKPHHWRRPEPFYALAHTFVPCCDQQALQSTYRCVPLRSLWARSRSTCRSSRAVLASMRASAP